MEGKVRHDVQSSLLSDPRMDLEEEMMHRLSKLAALVLIVGLLGGCYRAYIPPPDPYPYSFTDQSKEVYPRTLAGATRFIIDSRTRWQGLPNSTVQAPEVSAATLRGDCDDFSTMLACYLQEYWGYDTFILLIDLQGDQTYYQSANHAVCFVDSSDLVADATCTMPVIVSGRRTYWPLDWTACPGWMWMSEGGDTDFGFTYTYNAITGERYYFPPGYEIEWNVMVNLALSSLDEATGGHERLHAAVTNGDILPEPF